MEDERVWHKWVVIWLLVLTGFWVIFGCASTKSDIPCYGGEIKVEELA